MVVCNVALEFKAITPRHEAIMLQKVSIMLLSSAQKSPIRLLRIAHYSQNYATIIG